LCPSLEAKIPSDATLSKYENRVVQIQNVGGNDRAMLAFSNQTVWMANSSEAETLERSISQISLTGLSNLLSSPPIWGIDDSNRDLIIDFWEADFEKSIISSCGLGSAIAEAESATSRYDSAVNAAVSLAKSAPWYPSGYFELVDGLAGKWNTFSGAWPCYDCSFWKMEVVSRDGCPSGVYVEINITQGGTVVDWTNDSLAQLNSGRKGQMVFENYPYLPNSSGEVSDASCY